MASITRGIRSGSPWSLSMAFVERQTNLWKRYWGWELVWLVYGLVNTLAITFIAEQIGVSGRGVGDADAQELVLFLLIGTLVWAYLSAVLDDISLVVQWERWEGHDRAHADGACAAFPAPARHVCVRRPARLHPHVSHLRHRAFVLRYRLLAGRLGRRRSA